MRVVHALQPLQKSIMLLGPTPRVPEPGQDPTPSWRPGALDVFRDAGFDGLVFVPEAESWEQHRHYDTQLAWELEAINQCTVAMCWVPREITTMPAFTTNVEFGMLVKSGKLMFGFPADAPKMSYLKTVALNHHITIYHDLTALVHASIRRADQIHEATVA